MESARVARERGEAEARAAATLQQRVKAEERRQAAARERTAAESRAAGELQGRIDAEEALRRETAEADAAQLGAGNARQEREALAAKLAALRRLPRWKALAAAGTVIGVLAVALLVEKPRAPSVVTPPLAILPAGDPLDLRMDRDIEGFGARSKR